MNPDGHRLHLTTAHLDLVPFTAEAIEALLAGDRSTLRRLAGAEFPEPLGPPPLLEALLPAIRDRLRTDPETLGWWTWLAIDRRTGQVTGASGFGGPPDQTGAVMIGYATYPGAEGHGYASEAARALVAWALEHAEVSRVCASIPPDNAAARRVAEKLGMRVVGTVWEEDIDDVLLYAVDR
jgi:RimJ/RimL family protein N-acetyltransferase